MQAACFGRVSLNLPCMDSNNIVSHVHIRVCTLGLGSVVDSAGLLLGLFAVSVFAAQVVFDQSSVCIHSLGLSSVFWCFISLMSCWRTGKGACSSPPACRSAEFWVKPAFMHAEQGVLSLHTHKGRTVYSGVHILRGCVAIMLAYVTLQLAKTDSISFLSGNSILTCLVLFCFVFTLVNINSARQMCKRKPTEPVFDSTPINCQGHSAFNVVK